MAYWAKNYVTVLTRATHWMVSFDLGKPNSAYTNVMKAFKSKMQWCRRDTVAPRTTCVNNVKLKIMKNDRLSVFGILSLPQKPQLGRTKPLTGPHAALGLRDAHSWWRSCGILSKLKHYTTLPVLKDVCNSLIHLYLNYSIPKWGRASNGFPVKDGTA